MSDTEEEDNYQISDRKQLKAKQAFNYPGKLCRHCAIKDCGTTGHLPVKLTTLTTIRGILLES